MEGFPMAQWLSQMYGRPEELWENISCVHCMGASLHHLQYRAMFFRSSVASHSLDSPPHYPVLCGNPLSKRVVRCC